MTRSALRAWADDHADGPVATGPDRRHSLTSRLVRFRWNDALTVGVGSDADGKTRINAVLDALALFLGQSEPASATVHLIVGAGPDGAQDPSIREHLGAIGTLVSALAGGPTVRVWTLSPGTAPVEVPCATAEFTSVDVLRSTPQTAACAHLVRTPRPQPDAVPSRPRISERSAVHRWCHRANARSRQSSRRRGDRVPAAGMRLRSEGHARWVGRRSHRDG